MADDIITVPPIIIARCLLALSLFNKCKVVNTAGTPMATGNTLLVMVLNVGSKAVFLLWLMLRNMSISKFCAVPLKQTSKVNNTTKIDVWEFNLNTVRM